MEEIKHIDIKKSIRESNSKLLKKLPDPIIWAITKIVKQDELNSIITKYKDYIGREFLQKMIEELNLNVEVTGIENLPENGRCFFVSNHPFGIIDGLVLTYIITKKYGTVKSIANESFMLIPQLHPFIVAVNVFDGSSKDYIMALEDLYNQDVPISHFPAGEVSRRYNGKVQDCNWQKSFITKAVSSKRDVVPICFKGRNSNLFFLIFITRNLLGIKTNIELMLLPAEMFKKRGQTINVKIGKPIPWQTFDKSFSPFAWAQKVKTIAYSLWDNSQKNKVA